LNQEGVPCSGKEQNDNSGFNGPYCSSNDFKSDGIEIPRKKYYDEYHFSLVEDSYNRRILGDATGEIGPFFSKIYANNQQRYISSWYGDEGRFVWKEEEWFNRSNGLIVVLELVYFLSINILGLYILVSVFV